MQFFDCDKITSRIGRVICLQESIEEFLLDLPETLQCYKSSNNIRNQEFEKILYHFIIHFLGLIECIEQFESKFENIGKGILVNNGVVKLHRNRIDLQSKRILANWFEKNISHPYPSNQEKGSLVEMTNLTLIQVENWLINARRRNIKK